MYRNRSRRQATPFSDKVNSAFLLDSMETFANDLVALRPTKSSIGYWNLGYVANESVAKRNWHGLRGAAECLSHMRKCYEAADAEDNDHMKANARIEAATCLCLGADGLVGYKVNGDPVQARRNFRVDPNHEGSFPFRLDIFGGNTDAARQGAIEKETKRMEEGVPYTTFEPGECSLVPRWSVLKLWNEAMDAYDSLKEWEHHFFIYGEVAGWDSVVEFLDRTKTYTRSQYGNAMNFGQGFPGNRDRGLEHTLDTTCSVCGKKDDKPLMKCSRCKQVTYCSRDCQKKDYKAHKKVFKQL